LVLKIECGINAKVKLVTEGISTTSTMSLKEVTLHNVVDDNFSLIVYNVEKQHVSGTTSF